MGRGAWSGRVGFMQPVRIPEFRPPARDGVGASTLVLPVVAPPQQPTSLLSYLEQCTHITCGIDWYSRLKNGLIIDQNGAALGTDAPYRGGQRIWYWRHVAYEPRIPFDEQIVYQDAHLLVADKPHFLPVTPTGRYVQETLLVRLKRRTGFEALTPLHRIDRDTAGLVMFSVQASERDAYMRLFRQQQVHKTYECIAPHLQAISAAGPEGELLRLGQVFVRRSCLASSPHSFMQMCETPDEPNSETRITLLQVLHDGRARYRLEPLTGKRHQLRVHMMALGAPIAGDGIYPVLQPQPDADAVDYSRPLQLLASALRLTDPVTGLQHHFKSSRQLEGLHQPLT